MDYNNVTGEEEGVKPVKDGTDGRCLALKLDPTPLNLIEEKTAEEGQNPLQNPLIFHHVLSYLNNLKDLKNCRLVHSTWTAEASNLLKTNSIINISKKFLQTSKDDVISLEVLRQLEVFQPQNLLLFPNKSNCPDYSRKNWPIVKKQIKKLSNGVKYFKFSNTEIQLHQDHGHSRQGGKGTQRFTEILEYNFPNLVHLTLGDSNFSWPDVSPPPIHSLKQLDWRGFCKPPELMRPGQLKLLEGVLKLAPNLESLNLRSFTYGHWCRNGYHPPRYNYFPNHEPYERPNMFLDHFNSHPSSCPNLKDLMLEDLSPLDIDALLNLKIKLRSLKLSTLPMMTDYQKFHEFLKRQNGTLERLRLVFPVHRNAGQVTPHFTFPCLPKLKKLKLVHNFESFRMTFDDLDYAKMFPALQSLVIKFNLRNGDFIIGPLDSIWLISPVYRAFLPLCGEDLDRQVCGTLRVLKLPYPDQPELKREGETLFGIRERLSIMFPNVHNEHLDIGRARVAEGHPHLTIRGIPNPIQSQKPLSVVSCGTRSKANLLLNQI